MKRFIIIFILLCFLSGCTSKCSNDNTLSSMDSTSNGFSESETYEQSSIDTEINYNSSESNSGSNENESTYISNNECLLREDGSGDVKMNMSLEDFRKFLEKEKINVQFGNDGGDVQCIINGLLYYFQNNKLVSINSGDETSAKTGKGLNTGDNINRAVELYGTPTKEANSQDVKHYFYQLDTEWGLLVSYYKSIITEWSYDAITANDLNWKTASENNSSVVSSSYQLPIKDDGTGELHIGMSHEQFDELFYKKNPDDFDFSSFTNGSFAYFFKKLDIECHFTSSGLLEWVDVKSSQSETEKGIKVGNPSDVVLQKYGKAHDTVDDDDGKAYIYKYGKNKLVFIIDKATNNVSCISFVSEDISED